MSKLKLRQRREHSGFPSHVGANSLRSGKKATGKINLNMMSRFIDALFLIPLLARRRAKA